jgi:hypothetical protein
MADIAGYSGPFGGANPQKGDLYLESATFDLAEDEIVGQNILDELEELFEMTPADDLDYPELYSMQQSAYLGEEGSRSDGLRRIRDTRRMLALIPGIDVENSRVQLDAKNSIVLDLRLSDGRKLSRTI